MQRTNKMKVALAGTALTILTGLGIAAAAAPKAPGLAPAYKALDAFTGEWVGDSTVYISPGLPPTMAKAAESGEKVGQFWATLRLDTVYMDKPYGEVLMLGFDGTANKATGTIFSSSDPMARNVTGSFDTRSGTWVLFHETLNSAGIVVQAKTKIHVDERSGKRTLERYHILADNFETLALAVKSTRRER